MESQQPQEENNPGVGVDDGTLNEHLWGYLQSCNQPMTRIDLWRLNPVFAIGRNEFTNHLVVPSAKVSNSHCVISWDGRETWRDSVRVTDLSSNGTFVNGRKIGKNRMQSLEDGAELSLLTPTSSQQESCHEVSNSRFIYRHLAGDPEKPNLFNDYDVGDDLGKGAFGTVCLAIHRGSGVRYAVKMIAPLINPRLKKYLEREIQIMQRLAHRNICRIIRTYFHDDGAVNMVLELMEGGNLMDYVAETKTGLEEQVAQDITHQICDAVAYIHAQGITHRDLKLENILLARKQRYPLIKVADFGLAKLVDHATMLRTICGTPCFVAPEVFDPPLDGYDNLVDSWGVGVIVFTMLTNQLPFLDRNPQQGLEVHLRRRRIRWSLLNKGKDVISQVARQFIRRLLERRRSHRMSLMSARGHVWLREHVPLYGVVDSTAHPKNDQQPRRGFRTSASRARLSPHGKKKSINGISPISSGRTPKSRAKKREHKEGRAEVHLRRSSRLRKANR